MQAKRRALQQRSEPAFLEPTAGAPEAVHAAEPETPPAAPGRDRSAPPRRSGADRPQTPARPAETPPGEDTYTGRLLRAKERLRKRGR
jgi:hypothetical protein